MSSATTLGRRAFLSIPIGVGMAAAGVTLARPAFATPTSTAWVLSTTWSTPRGTRGRTHCTCSACRSHGANKIFATETDAGATLAHVGCLCVPTPHAIATTTYEQLFATAVTADRRDPATLAILTAAQATAPVNGPTPTNAPTSSPLASPTVSVDPTNSPIAASPMSASPVPSSSVPADARATASATAAAADPTATAVTALSSPQPVATSGQQQAERAAAVVGSPALTPSASVTPSASSSQSAVAVTARAATARPGAAARPASHGSLALWLPLPIVAATAALGGLIWLRNRAAAAPVQPTGQRPPGAHRAVPPQPES